MSKSIRSLSVLLVVRMELLLALLSCYSAWRVKLDLDRWSSISHLLQQETGKRTHLH